MKGRRRIALPSATLAACGALAALLSYASDARRADALSTKGRTEPASRPQHAAPFATIGIGACSDSNIERATPAAAAPPKESCTAPVKHDAITHNIDLASVSLVDDPSSHDATAISYLP